MNRLKLIQEIETQEKKLIVLKNLLKDMGNFYFDGGCITFRLQSRDFNKKYDGEEIVFDNDLMNEYLKSEINLLENKIKDNIKRLSE